MLTIRDQLRILEDVADSIHGEANELADLLKHWTMNGEYKDPSRAEVLEAVKEVLLDEIGVIRSMIADVRHQEDCDNTAKLFIRRCNEDRARALEHVQHRNSIAGLAGSDFDP